MEVHAKTIKALDNLTGEFEAQRLEIVEDLKRFLRKHDTGMNKKIRILFHPLIEKWEGKK